MTMGNGVSGEDCLGRTPRVLYAYTHIIYILYLSTKNVCHTSRMPRGNDIYIERVGCSEIRCVCIQGGGGFNVKSHPPLVYVKYNEHRHYIPQYKNNLGRVFLFLLLFLLFLFFIMFFFFFYKIYGFLRNFKRAVIYCVPRKTHHHTKNKTRV